MKVDFRLPFLSASDADGKIEQLVRFLYQHIQELNWAFNSIGDETEAKQEPVSQNAAVPFKVYDRSYSKVECTTKSANGTYYGGVESYSAFVDPGYTVVSAYVVNWTGTAASVGLYGRNSLLVYSDVSQTIATLDVRVLAMRNT